MGGVQPSQDLHPWEGHPQMRGWSPWQRFSPGSKWSKLHLRLASLGVQYWEEAPRASGFKGQQSLRKEELEDTVSIPKGCTQNLTHSSPSIADSALKEPWARPTNSSWRDSQRGRKQLGLALGTQTLVVAISGSSLSCENTGANEHYYAFPSPGYQQQGLTCPSVGQHRLRIPWTYR